ncbi:hypothetical protein GS399_19960 [Pedobacter sp. HMF7647]|uniref:chitinase n=1 Tax=Hufsiella arboris TaxID=2695275 RepID=A0A7K1YGD5_9SPHI|nr:glycoside hydrolase family 18 protein [Hufsiella arboris]MXV53248.1 hypothetical protein [Hufsiella arboris]
MKTNKCGSVEQIRKFGFVLIGLALLGSLEFSCRQNEEKKIASNMVQDTSKKDASAITDKRLSVSKIFPPPAIYFKIVAYVIGDRKPETIPDQKIRQLNMLVFAFGEIQNNGGVFLKESQNLLAFSNKAHRNKCKISLSINGKHENFKSVTSDSLKRARCIRQLMQIVRTHHLDGLDIDWEFPSRRDKTDSVFTVFLKQLSDSCHLGGRYYLSCAITPGTNKGRRSSAIRKELLTGDWVDWFNVMVYDEFSLTKPYKHHSDFNMAYRSFWYWLKIRKMPQEKAVMGLPLYGRPSGIPQKDHVLNYSSIIAKGGNAFLDSAVILAQKPIRQGDTSRLYTIYYDGIKTIQRKARGAKRYGGGIMFWEFGMDTNDQYSLINAAYNTVIKTSKVKIKQ